MYDVQSTMNAGIALIPISLLPLLLFSMALNITIHICCVKSDSQHFLFGWKLGPVKLATITQILNRYGFFYISFEII